MHKISWICLIIITTFFFSFHPFLSLAQDLSGSYQATINFDFEPTVNKGKPFLLWATSTHPIHLDTLHAHQGRGSMLIQPQNKVLSIYTRSLPIDPFKGKILSLHVYMKAEAFTGFAGIYASVLSERQSERLAYAENIDSVFADTTWKKISLQLPVSEQADKIAIGLRTFGKGKVWFDAMQVWMGEEVYIDSPLQGTEPFLAPPRQDSSSVQAAFSTGDPFAQHTATLPNNHESSSVLRQAAPSLLLKQLSLDSLQGKMLSFKGQLKLTGSAHQKAHLYVAFLLEDRGYHERYQYIPYTLPAAEQEWIPFDIQASVPANAFLTTASFGIATFGQEQVLVEGLEVLVDGTPYQDPTTASVSLPTGQQLSWLKSKVISLQTTSPKGEQKDLLRLNSVIGQSRLVGLGEVSHGSHEIFEMKHRLFRYLVEQKGFTLLAMEAEMGASARLNDYILHGKGEAKALLAGLGFWTWNTEEILAMIEWMRSYNAAKPAKKIQFVGFDMQSAGVAIENLLAFASKQDSSLVSYLSRLKPLVGQLKTEPSQRNVRLQKKDTLLTTIEALLQLIRDRLEVAKLRDLVSLDELAWLKQNERLIYQYVTLQNMPDKYNYRDACMAENLHWTLNRHKGEKVAIWAHNNHIAKQGKEFIIPMGARLKREYGDAYFAAGFSFHQGSYRAIEDNQLAQVKAQVSYPGSYEYYFHSLGMHKQNIPATLLPLQGLSLKEENKWLFERLFFRDIGAVAAGQEYNFTRHELKKEFDALLYIHQSTPSIGVTK
ncbi:erythromycin esterase family protein [Rhodocytophaga aerolata]|uniref:Erythromycin esterase family protein n=1 Tax=Rhodocytophaga aerolata TaxID=455078 RepID=A0ABT8RHX8_9BACT|nr:erythromycin esterase family protein [Rhodocytophaga aerolata]MDO1451698.1 erythromycin esterase family protein [Rhodocytophaga aerolata]